MGFLFFASARIRSFILKLLSFDTIVLHGDRFSSPARWAISIFTFWIPNISLSVSFRFCSVSAQDSSSHSLMPSKRKLSRLERSSKILSLLLFSSLSFFNFSISLLNVSLILPVEFSISLSLSSVMFSQYLALDNWFLSLYYSIDSCYLQFPLLIYQEIFEVVFYFGKQC